MLLIPVADKNGISPYEDVWRYRYLSVTKNVIFLFAAQYKKAITSERLCFL